MEETEANGDLLDQPLTGGESTEIAIEEAAPASLSLDTDV